MDENKEIKKIAGISFGSLLFLFSLSLLSEEFLLFIGIITIMPLVIGRLILRNKDLIKVFSLAFWFMVFNLIFIFILLFTVGKAAFPDVVFPIAYYYFSLSPFFFSIGGLIKKDSYFLIMLLSIISLPILMYYIPYIRVIIFLINLFHFYNIFLVVQYYLSLKRHA